MFMERNQSYEDQEKSQQVSNAANQMKQKFFVV